MKNCSTILFDFGVDEKKSYGVFGSFILICNQVVVYGSAGMRGDSVIEMLSSFPLCGQRRSSRTVFDPHVQNMCPFLCQIGMTPLTNVFILLFK